MENTVCVGFCFGVLGLRTRVGREGDGVIGVLIPKRKEKKKKKGENRRQ